VQEARGLAEELTRETGRAFVHVLDGAAAPVAGAA
jgi:hypothetical protein